MAKNTAELNITFNKRDTGPEAMLAEAEILLPSPFDGLKLVGFTVWKTAKGDLNVTFPARAFGAGSDRKFYDFVRYVEKADATKRLKDVIIAAYKQWAEKSVAA